MAAKKPCKPGKVRRRVKGGRSMCLPKKRKTARKTTRKGPAKKRVMRKKTWIIDGKAYSPNSRVAERISRNKAWEDYKRENPDSWWMD